MCVCLQPGQGLPIKAFVWNHRGLYRRLYIWDYIGGHIGDYIGGYIGDRMFGNFQFLWKGNRYSMSGHCHIIQAHARGIWHFHT